jgi:hypothetical protein
LSISVNHVMSAKHSDQHDYMTCRLQSTKASLHKRIYRSSVDDKAGRVNLSILVIRVMYASLCFQQDKIICGIQVTKSTLEEGIGISSVLMYAGRSDSSITSYLCDVYKVCCLVGFDYMRYSVTKDKARGRYWHKVCFYMGWYDSTLSNRPRTQYPRSRPLSR